MGNAENARRDSEEEGARHRQMRKSGRKLRGPEGRQEDVTIDVSSVKGAGGASLVGISADQCSDKACRIRQWTWHEFELPFYTV